ncbi:MAG: diguanylate cyclase domain-containing protein [Alkalispirochaeta sp.]
MFNPDLVIFGMHSTPVVTVGVLTALWGVVVALRVRWSRLGLWYLAFAGSVATYAIAVGISYAVTTSHLSLFWDRVAHIGISFMPWAFYGSASAILGVLSSVTQIKIRRNMLIVALIQVSLVWWTDLIIAGNYRTSWGWFSEYGIVGLLFLAYFAVVLIVVLRRYLLEYRARTVSLQRRRLAWQIVAILFGFGAGVDVLPAVGFNLFPFGFIPIGLFAVITGFAILHYRLVDITLELAAPTILKTLSSAIVVTDRNEVVRIANSRAHELLGVPDGSLVNCPLDETSAGEAIRTSELPMSVPFRDAERPVTFPDGRTVVLSLSASYLTDHRNNVVGTVYVVHDITKRKRAEEELEHLALYDDLTGLPNRKLFFDRFEMMLNAARRDGTTCALLYLDLNGFKKINDEYGHQAGDTVLRLSAQRIRSTIRDIDTVARIGGDEFVVLCGELHDPEVLSGIVAKIRDALVRNIRLPDRTVAVGVSIGTALFPEESEDRDVLLSIADRRMYGEKDRMR